jgi:type IV pilus assembly protein PilB
MNKQEELLKKLIEKNLIEASVAEKIFNRAQKENKLLEDILISSKAIEEETLIQIKAEIFGLEYISLIEKKIEPKILNIISKEVSENYKIVCFDRSEKIIMVGIIDPSNFKAIEAVDFLAKENNFSVKYFLISKKSFGKAFENYESISDEVSTALKSKIEGEEGLEVAEEKEEAELEDVTKSAPVAKIVSVIIRHAVEGGASDIHIEPMQNESRVRYRIDGILHTSLVLPRSVYSAIVARVKVMANLKLDETRIPQDGRIRLIINDREVDFRVSVLPLIGAEKVVLRILDTTKGAPSPEELGFQGIQFKILQKNIKKTEGLFLVTGPTGSGKSTTLFSILDIINKEGVNISTLEDPVEYQMKGVNQSQVKPEIGYTFASGLRSFLRQDPDVIMVGEIRDEETAELAVHAALTGHFVLSTLHTNSAVGAIPRLIDMKIEPFLMVSTLSTIVAQRLARRICPHCKEEIKIPEDYKEELLKEIKDIGEDYIKTIIKDFDINNLKFYKGKGCPRCGNSGYSGRISILEVLDINDKMKDYIINNKINLSQEDIKKTQKYISIKQDGIIKVLTGVTTIEEILRVMKD